MTATADNGYFSSGTATVDIAVQAAQLQMYESDGSTVLAHSTAVTSGGWVLENTNDYNYALDSNNNLIPADQQSGGVAGDAALLKLGATSAANTAAAGHFAFQISSDLNLWQDANRTGAYTGANVIPIVNPSPWYVEGTAVSPNQGSDYVALYWVAPNGQTFELDQVKYSVYAITGPQNVPGYGDYWYSVQLPGGAAVNNSDWGAAGGKIADYSYLPGAVQVAWNSGPAIGVVQYTPAGSFTGDWNVNVVGVAVTQGALTLLPPVPKNQAATGAIGGGFLTVNAPDDITFTNSVTVSGAGPQGDWGLKQISIGYIQEDTFVTEDGTYQNGTTLKSDLDGATYTDWATGSQAPWADSTKTPTAPYVVNGVTYISFFQPQSDGQQVTLRHFDLPGELAPSENNGSALASVNLLNEFTRFVAVATDDSEIAANNGLYFGLAKAQWQANYQGTIANGVFTASAPQAITSDAGFSLANATTGSFHIPITTTSANQAVGGEVWNQTASLPPVVLGRPGPSTCGCVPPPRDGMAMAPPPNEIGLANWTTPASSALRFGVFADPYLFPLRFSTWKDWLWSARE